jgi:hypothetical protein
MRIHADPNPDPDPQPCKEQKQTKLAECCTYELEELLAEAALIDALLSVELHDKLFLEVLRVLHDYDLQLHQRVLHNVIATHLDCMTS